MVARGCIYTPYELERLSYFHISFAYMYLLNGINLVCYHMDVAYGWMAMHACSIYITRDACIHDWTHGTDMILIKEVN